jgi:hypothetical protein
MDVSEPRLRRRGFFLHSLDGEPDTGEHENPEGLVVRVRMPDNPVARKMVGASSRGVPGTRFSSGRQLQAESDSSEGQPAIRSGSVTGSRQRAHMSR